MTKKDIAISIKRAERFHQLISKRVLKDSIDMHCEYTMLQNGESFNDRNTFNYQSITKGTEWGKKWECALFHLQVKVPREWKDKALVLKFDFGGEGLVYDHSGKIIQGISNGSVFDYDFNRDLVHLKDMIISENLVFWVEASSNGLFGMFTEQDPEEDSKNRYGYYNSSLNYAKLAIFDEEIYGFWLDLRILMGLVKRLPDDSVRRFRIIRSIDEAINLYRDGLNDIKPARERLGRELNKEAAPSDLTAYAVGHAHIDTAWLWPVRETIKKCARTFSSQLKLINDYEGYVFGASQPQHYQFVKDYYPELYQRIKDAVKEGRWELQGGMWVEADCNIISGESMIRQILHGKNFFKDEFDVEVKNLWLPDVFGYSAALPQILNKSGIDYFLTQKISWNQYNDFPHHTFLWQGIDGTDILTHFPPENNYNSQLDSEYLVPAQTNFREKDFIDEFISLFGVGDGGGGPKEENIECGIRLKNLEGSPKVKFASATEFFDKIEGYRKQLSRWNGELYLELHRGTLTTQASTKFWNRKLEEKLTSVEKLCSLLPVDSYPSKELDKLWKMMLINQFHDIIPGSSINETYKVATREYKEINSDLDNIIGIAATKLFDSNPDSMILFNTNSYNFIGEATLPETWGNTSALDEHGNRLETYTLGTKRYVYIEIPAYSFKTLSKGEELKSVADDWSELILENALIRYEFSKDGRLISCYDKETGNRVDKEGKESNLLTLYNDRPNDWDAWDIDIFYEENIIEHLNAESVEYLPKNSYKQGLIFNYEFGNSSLKQKVVLLKDSKRLDFITEVDWKEKHRMLRVAFPVNIQTDQASFDIQYGFVKRNTHRNTQWDKAKFEVVGHKFADLSDSHYGVALLNDCKYGYKVFENTLDLNLLRSPTYPDPDADMGFHKFTYSLLPHLGTLTESEVFSEAKNLNNPPMMLHGFTGTQPYPIGLRGEGLQMEVVKKHEKESFHVIRIVEIHGKTSNGTMFTEKESMTIQETDLMEWKAGEEKPLNGLQLELKPFEIKTFIVRGMRV